MQDECKGFLNEILMQDISNDGRYDIRFNFIIGEFGIFEGRGWNAVPDMEGNQLYIGFVSIFEEEECTEFTEHLIRNGIRLGKLDEDFDDDELVRETTASSLPTTPGMTSTAATSDDTTETEPTLEPEPEVLPLYHAYF